MKGCHNILPLVDALPELYQPIFNCAGLDKISSRPCEDRWLLIRQVYEQACRYFNRPLRVLDLGCAQGFFSMHLAAEGASVYGVDFNDKNIAVCCVLAEHYPEYDVRFEQNDIQVVIDDLELDQYDLVLGLSVFHHLIHAQGLASVQRLIAALAEKIPLGIYELALKDEPLYWATSQPDNPEDVLKYYGFLSEISRLSTHLSVVTRPLYVATSIARLLPKL